MGLKNLDSLRYIKILRERRVKIKNNQNEQANIALVAHNF